MPFFVPARKSRNPPPPPYDGRPKHAPEKRNLKPMALTPNETVSNRVDVRLNYTQIQGLNVTNESLKINDFIDPFDHTKRIDVILTAKTLISQPQRVWVPYGKGRKCIEVRIEWVDDDEFEG
jgi:hypothetical protein